MAEHTIETRILLRYDTYTNWMNSNVILKKGEAAICSFPSERVVDQLSNTTPENTPPAIGIKIGDNFHYFRELPWVQAVAADVYKWAKTSTKPTYTASEITGLQSFIEENFHISGDITIAPRIYQIIEGTGDDANKYFLRYKENNEEGEWVVDTNHPIDVSAYQRVVDWIGAVINNFPTLGNYNAQHIRSILSELSSADSAENNKFITSVSQTNGLISVEKAQPNFTNIAGTASVIQGGTGRTTLTDNNVLVGNGQETIKLIPIAESIAANNHLVPNYLIKAYVDSAVAGLTGAMHFIGEATVVITNNSTVDPNIIMGNGQRYNFSTAQPGDVILFGTKEFVWTGGVWHLLGDEGSYAVKGSITDEDIAPDAGIQQSKIANLSNTLLNKVDKVEGKMLSSNDFSDELKDKLDLIENGAQRNKIEHIFIEDEEIIPTTIGALPNSVRIAEFPTAAADKLATIEMGAQKNKIEKIVYDDVELTPDEDRIVTIVSDPHTEHENVIEHIIINSTEYIPNENKEVRITLDETALNLDILKGAQVPSDNGPEDVEISLDKKLKFARIAKTGNISDIYQTDGTYVILDCGTSTTQIISI